jgi:putative MATE family efflux protein
VDRRLLSLAVPALGALVAEPLFILVDSAVVGRLGTAQLAGLALASTVLVTLVGLFVFLAYATTAAAARRIGAGDERGALAAGVDGMWLALLLGVATALAGWLAAPWAVAALGASPGVAPHAVAYLKASLPGMPAMLVVLAATGTLRGRQDTRTPLVVAAAGAAVNAALSVLLVHGAGLGIAGAGLGTALTQTAMAIVLGGVVVRSARGLAVPLRPAITGVLSSAHAGVPLLVRTLCLRVGILLTVLVAASLGDVALAAHQVVAALWSLAAYTLDALAIAAQALVGHALGARDPGGARSLTARSLRWGTAAGAGVGLVMAAGGWWLAPLFTADGDVRRAAALALAVTGLALPMAGWVYVLDGVLIGAGDGRFLAGAGIVTLLAYAPLLAAVVRWAPDGAVGLAWLWATFAGGFMLARAVTTGLRARGQRWLVLGPG